jgi:hypothetical protein
VAGVSHSVLVRYLQTPQQDVEGGVAVVTEIVVAAIPPPT